MRNQHSILNSTEKVIQKVIQRFTKSEKFSLFKETEICYKLDIRQYIL